ncbi:hypothetical protein BDB00DRAFT_935247 [Zychaea mexicana]|uniref:uncharacterized protein n=1 Tax=Zychaea mexicana TaxID=64656 RepID=UPI0022FDFD34|nr:uncharacterized protein BDB00DRAFT_935247 [Zychaea mexicana]KAI9499004.1 hypothetical protein BDB00DRAFT_935247 [Zychaea mexicana]
MTIIVSCSSSSSLLLSSSLLCHVARKADDYHPLLFSLGQAVFVQRQYMYSSRFWVESLDLQACRRKIIVASVRLEPTDKGKATGGDFFVIDSHCMMKEVCELANREQRRVPVGA